MAMARVTKFGLQVNLNHTELTILTTHLTTGSASVGVITAVLAGFGISAPAAVVSAIISAVLCLGASALNSCNAKQRGVSITVFWVGVPYCRGI
jgi:hypothetical protein